MSAASASFGLLDERIQRFIWEERWEALREAQEAAIPLIVRGDCDVIIAAATAAGKTEAAFFPALTRLQQSGESGLIVYISPLKALINDQFARLERLCEQLEVPVWPWHGDVSSTSKTRFMAKRHGVLLITPESLEAVLCNRGASIEEVFERTAFFVIDELHSFIGTERGKQLQSLMHRIEHVLGRAVPRIGLSATLGDMNLAADFLRPDGGQTVRIIDSRAAGAELKVLVKGYEEPTAVSPPTVATEGDQEGTETQEQITPRMVAEHLFKSLRGSNNLVFPNRRREVERYTYLLNELCETRQVPKEFWPHHGNLSKEIRAEAERALKQKERPATAICTNTLELGIDIGSVKSVAQIGPPPSVAGLRQRLGRSGRRKGEAAILRGYCIEDGIAPGSSLNTELRLSTIQMCAMISLLLEGWFEPPAINGAHYSTLVQQVLSVIAQRGGARIGELYDLLCGRAAPFAGVAKEHFAMLIRHLGAKELLMQDAAGDLLHGRVGEKFVNHYSFYAAFQSDEEFRIVAEGRPLGTLPVVQVLTAGQRILFGGRTWRVEQVDEANKVIYVARTSGGVPPIFSGGTGRIHTRVRQRMREILEGTAFPPFLDDRARRFLSEARQNYATRDLRESIVVDYGRDVQILTWLGDAANEAIACLLLRRGYTAAASGPGVEVSKGRRSTEDVLDALIDAGLDERPPLHLLLSDVTNLQREKWDWALPDELLRLTYVSSSLSLDEALEWVSNVSRGFRSATESHS